MVDASVSHENVRASNVTGTYVYNPDGENIGHVEDIVLGKRDGTVKYAILSVGGFLGIGEEYHPLPWSELDYSESFGGFVINRTREQLENAPRFRAGSDPDWSDRVYGDEINRYYGRPHL